MKKSEKYQLALCAVIDSNRIPTEDKVDVVEMLLEAKSVAEYTERQEEGKSK